MNTALNLQVSYAIELVTEPRSDSSASFAVTTEECKTVPDIDRSDLSGIERGRG